MKQVFNPYLPSYEYIPDGEPHIFNDRLYIYGSHDRFGGTDYCQNDYVCWSTPVTDLSAWRYEGIIYKKEQHPYRIGRNLLFAPDVAQGKDGRYYLYYSIADSGIMSVAVCDKPAGQYQYYGDLKFPDGRVSGRNAGDYFHFDPGIFIDDDGSIFLFSGFCPGRLEDEQGRKYVGCHMYELEDDMLTIKRGPVIVIDRNTPEDIRYFEAPSMRKINKNYYLIYSVRVGGLHYYISDKPDRGFVYGGRIHSTSDVGLAGHSVDNPIYPNGNTHGSIIEICGRYYVFDHRLTNNSSYNRQGVAEEITIESDGRIKQVESTSCGLNHGPLIGKGEYPSYIACALMDYHQYATKEEKRCSAPCITQDGEDRESGSEQYITKIHNQCVVGYKYFNLSDCKKIALTVRGNAEGILHIKTEESGEDVTQIICSFYKREWIEIQSDFNIKGRKSALFFLYEGKGQFDLLKISFI